MIFSSISEAVKEYPDLVKKYMGSVVRQYAGGRTGAVQQAAQQAVAASSPVLQCRRPPSHARRRPGFCCAS